MFWFKSAKEKHAEVKIKFLIPQVKRILEDSLRVINSTENIKTGISRFETIKTLIRQLFNEIPEGEIEKYLKEFSMKISVNDQDIKSYNDLKIVDDAKNQWVEKMVFDQIENEKMKADALTEKKLKKQQMKKALKVALDSLNFLPENNALKGKISEIESEVID